MGQEQINHNQIAHINMSKRFVSALVLSLGAIGISVASEPFNGLLIDNYGKGVKVKVHLVQAGTFTISDKEGKFGFTDVGPNDTLKFKYQREWVLIPIQGRRSAKIILVSPEERTVSDEPELVDMGFEYVPRREYTGSSTGITQEIIERGNYNNLADVISSHCAGVTVEPNGQIIIRGTNSIECVAHALILVDGGEVSSIYEVNIHDVKSVEIQKDGTLYGFRGVNGVVQIRTKDGSSK